MNLLPVESAYTLMRISVEQLPSANTARRDELLVAIETFARGFAHLVRGHMKEDDPQARDFLGHAKTISDAARQLQKAWPSAVHYDSMKHSVTALLMVLGPLRGKRMFND